MNRALRTLLLIAAALLNGCTATAQQKPESASTRLATAEAMFAERCKKAGVFIHRTAENVEGVFLLKLRPEGINYRDQFATTDPYGRDMTGNGYIKSFCVEATKPKRLERLSKVRPDLPLVSATSTPSTPKTASATDTRGAERLLAAWTRQRPTFKSI
ncbi:MAG: hypothetical protein IPH08_05500 [Rhodocyclaceae bacterium]|nr:hypothetical protein [Rhodocyclaceae bacterium]